LNGTRIVGAVSITNNGGTIRLTVNGTTAISPKSGAVIIIEGTTSYNSASTGVTVTTRVSDTQFDVGGVAYVANESGTYRIRIVASGGAAYTTFMP